MYENFKIANYNNSLVSLGMYARQFAKLTSGDIITRFGVTPGSGLKVVLDAGDAIIRPSNTNVSTSTGQFVSLVGSTFPLDIPTPDASNPRLDLVVIYVDNSVVLPVIDAENPPTAANLDGPGVAKAVIVSGTPAATPVAPTSTAIQSAIGAGNNYTVVAQVRVDPGVSVIASNKITDLRKMVVIGAQNIDCETQPWNPEVTGFSGTPDVTARYSRVGKRVNVFITASGTSNSSEKFFTLPVPPAAWQDGVFGENAHTSQASNYIAGTLFEVANNRIKVYRGFNQATSTSMITPWISSGAASFTLHMSYEAA